MCIPEYPVRLMVFVTDLDCGFAKNTKMSIPPVVGMTLTLYHHEKEGFWVPPVKRVMWDEKENLTYVYLIDIREGHPTLPQVISTDPSWQKTEDRW